MDKMIQDKIDKMIEFIVVFINRTILRGYRSRWWDKMTKVEGVGYRDYQFHDLFDEDKNGKN